MWRKELEYVDGLSVDKFFNTLTEWYFDLRFWVEDLLHIHKCWECKKWHRSEDFMFCPKCYYYLTEYIERER